MAQPYVGEIRMFAGNFAPAGWMFCEGQQIPISENETLFNLIGTTYGGDGQTYFNLPDLRGRLPIHMGNGFTLAETGGVEQVTLATAQIPSHSHSGLASSAAGNAASPAGNLWAKSALAQYDSSGSYVNMPAQALGSTGGSQPHDNMMPYLAVSFIISLYGIFPSQS